MIVISLTYITSTEEADRLMEGHLAWLKAGFAEKGFLASGRKVPRTGGVILSRGSREEVEAYLRTDPFVTEGIARYDLTEVAVTTTAEGLGGLKD